MKPYIICHMLSSVDGKIDGAALGAVMDKAEYEATAAKLNGDAWIWCLAERGHDDAGADRVDPRAALAPSDGFEHYAQRIPAFGKLIGVQRVVHLVGLQHRQLEQLLDRRCGKGVVLFRRKRRQPIGRTVMQ